MLTSGDIQFEPPLTSKLTQLTTSLAVMQSGDAAFHSEIMWGVISEVQERVKAYPNEWWLASDVADLYIKYRNAAKLKRAEAEILSLLGLTRDTFISNQQQINNGVAEQITRDFINYEVPYVSVLIVGVDPLGPHIFVVDNGVISWNDVIGFAAIGIGARHAESQFMLATHWWNSPLADTALLTYVAKKRSEVAPGVGAGTDMFTVGPHLGTFSILPVELVRQLEHIYRKMKAREDRSQKSANDEVNEYVNQLQAQRAAQQEIDTRQEPLGEGPPAGKREKNGAS
jgi:hypothetical protein